LIFQKSTADISPWLQRFLVNIRRWRKLLTNSRWDN
jgi:hypothetical protein